MGMPPIKILLVISRRIRSLGVFNFISESVGLK